MQRAVLAHRYYGYRRIAAHLRREGFLVSPKKVRRLMHEDNLVAIRRRKFVITTDSDHRFRIHPNLAQHLELTDMDQLWVADLTYLRLEQEFAYLAVVLDAYSRRVIGWELGRSLEGRLTLDALEKAITARQPRPGLVHHSDQGIQYAAQSYVDRLEACGAVLSMSRPGSPWENGKVGRSDPSGTDSSSSIRLDRSRGGGPSPLRQGRPAKCQDDRRLVVA